MPSRQQTLLIADLRGGQNSADPPHALGDTQVVAALNVDWFGATLAHKRAGASAVTLTADPSFTAFTDYIGFLHPQRAFVATSGTSITDTCLVAVDADGIMGVIEAGTTRTTYLPTNYTLLTTPWVQIAAAELNGKCYLCSLSAKNRTLVLEQTGSSAFTVRYSGVATPAAATVADTGAGAYASVIRYYKVAYTVQVSGTTIRRSELSASVSFTPSGAGTAARVTKPATISEGETHWELYASADDTVYKLIATTAVGTTTYDDSTAPSAYSGNAPATAGSNTPTVAWKYIAAHGNRLVGAGSLNTATANQSRVWFTAVLGASDVGDLERVPTANYVDLDENDGDLITGIAGNFLGAVYVFKRRQIWKLVPTGDADAPFSKVCLTKMVGAVSHRSICVGEDENGNPALYFLSPRGPYRLSAIGLEYLGADIEDIWATVYHDSTYPLHGVYHAEKHQVWWWLTPYPVGEGSQSLWPTFKMMFDVSLGRRSGGSVRGGWAKHTGASCTALHACMGPYSTYNTLSSQKPYVGGAGAAGQLLYCDSGTQDAAANYQAYVTTKPYTPGGLGFMVNIQQSHLLALVGSSVTITQTLVRDYGLESRTSTCVLTAASAESRVLRQFEGSELTGAGTVQITIGDAAAANNTWTLDALAVPFTVQEYR